MYLRSIPSSDLTYPQTKNQLTQRVIFPALSQSSDLLMQSNEKYIFYKELHYLLRVVRVVPRTSNSLLCELLSKSKVARQKLGLLMRNEKQELNYRQTILVRIV